MNIVEVNIVEVSTGKRIKAEILPLDSEDSNKKQYENVAGCLIAYCCRLSFEKGYDGFVSLVPKTQLIKHYQKMYGFEQFGRQLAVYSTIAERLILRHL